MDNAKKNRVSSLQSIFLLSAAIAIDVVQFLLNLFLVGGIVNRIISPLVWMFFTTWFYFLGIRFMKSPKSQASSLVGAAIEMIPYVDTLPGWTVSTLIIISLSRREDKIGQSSSSRKGRLAEKDSAQQKTGRDSQINVSQTTKITTSVDSGVKESPKQIKTRGELLAAQTSGDRTETKGTVEDWGRDYQQTIKEASAHEAVKKESPSAPEAGKLAGAEEHAENIDQEMGEFEDLPMDKKEKLNADPYREAPDSEQKAA